MSGIIKENPLTQGTPRTLLPQPCVLVIFGAAGDLAWRKLLPAIYNLNSDGVLPCNFAVVGFGMGSQGDPDEWLRTRARTASNSSRVRPLTKRHWNDFARALFFVEGSFNDARAYEQLKAKLDAVDQQFGIPGSRVFYLAIPPQLRRCQRESSQGSRAGQPGRARDVHARHRREADRPRPGERPRDQHLGGAGRSPRARPIASTTTWARRRCRTCWCCASPTASSSRCGTEVHRPRADHRGRGGRRSSTIETGEMIGSRSATTRASARCATWCRTTCCRCCAWWPWSRPGRWTPTSSATPRSSVLHCLRPLTPATLNETVVRGQYIERRDSRRAGARLPPRGPRLLRARRKKPIAR